MKALPIHDPLDPLAKSKDAAQRRLYALLRDRLDGQANDVMRALGNPPDVSRLSGDFWATEAGRMLGDIRPEVERMMLDAIAAESVTVPVLWDEAVIAREAADWASQYVGELIRGIDQNTLDFVRRQVQSWIETPGQRIGDLRATLTPAFGERRAQTIAVTETTRAFAEGQKLVKAELERGGIRRLRKWNTSGDEKRVCEQCRDLDSKTEDEWSGTDGPPLHVNCRCWTTFVEARQ